MDRIPIESSATMYQMYLSTAISVIPSVSEKLLRFQGTKMHFLYGARSYMQRVMYYMDRSYMSNGIVKQCGATRGPNDPALMPMCLVLRQY